MRIYATSAYPEPEPIQSFVTLARFGKRHHLTDDANDADAILFVENSRYHEDAFFSRLKNHPLVRQHRERCFMYNEHDRPWCILPGVYCSMPKSQFNHRRQRATRYIRLLNSVDSFSSDQPDILFSFVGNSRIPLRRKILQLRSSRAILEDTSIFNPFVTKSTTGDHTRYAEILRRSKFVLCPRGAGTSSIRLFETLRAGRVPIIVADQWVAPEGPDWSTCSLRINECDIDHIEQIAADAEPRWANMAADARQVWAAWFADEVLFDRIGDAIEDLRRCRLIPEQIAQRIPSRAEWDWRARRALNFLSFRLNRANSPKLFIAENHASVSHAVPSIQTK
jgi:Exostosin family